MNPDLEVVQNISYILNNVGPSNNEFMQQLLSRSTIIEYLSLQQKIKVYLFSLGLLGLFLFGITPVICSWLPNGRKGNKIIAYWSLNIVFVSLLFPYLKLMGTRSEQLQLPCDFIIPETTGISTELEQLFKSIHLSGFNIDRLCFNRFDNGLLTDGFQLEISIGTFKARKLGKQEQQQGAGKIISDYRFSLDFESVDFQVAQLYMPKIST